VDSFVLLLKVLSIKAATLLEASGANGLAFILGRFFTTLSNLFLSWFRSLMLGWLAPALIDALNDKPFFAVYAAC